MMAFIGVRSSWLMLARNCDLCLLAISSWRPLSSISRKRRAFWMATAQDAILAKQRNGQESAVAQAHEDIAEPALIGVGSRDIRDLDRLAGHGEATDGAFPLPQGHRPGHLEELLGEVLGRP